MTVLMDQQNVLETVLRNMTNQELLRHIRIADNAVIKELASRLEISLNAEPTAPCTVMCDACGAMTILPKVIL